MSQSTKERPINLKAWEVKALMDGRLSQLRRVIKCNCNSIHIDRLLGDWGLSLPPHRWDGNTSSIGWRWKGDREPEINDWVEGWQTHVDDHASGPVACPFKIGERLWVRETWADVNTENGPAIMYRSGGLHFCVDDAYPVEYERYPGMNFSMWCGDLARGEEGHFWRRSTDMPRWASRITLEITGLGVERIQGISIEDVIAVGVPPVENGPHANQYWREETGAKFVSLWDRDNGPGSWDRNEWAWVIGVRRLEDRHG